MINRLSQFINNFVIIIIHHHIMIGRRTHEGCSSRNLHRTGYSMQGHCCDLHTRKLHNSFRLQQKQTSLQAREQSQDWHRPPKKQLHDEQPQQLKAQQPLSSHTAPFWCDVCKVPCMTAFHLKQHQQGKKQKAKWEKVLGGKNTDKKRPLWCNECSIPCMDETAMAQRCVERRHAARLLVIKAEQTECERVAMASHGGRDMGLRVDMDNVHDPLYN